jgi:hypothetical protein
MWSTAHDNARIQAFAQTARSLRQRTRPKSQPID